MVIAFDEAQNTLTTLRTLRTDEKISEVFQRAQILADSIEVLLQHEGGLDDKYTETTQM